MSIPGIDVTWLHEAFGLLSSQFKSGVPDRFKGRWQNGLCSKLLIWFILVQFQGVPLSILQHGKFLNVLSKIESTISFLSM